MRNNGGFTLIELILVTVIIGILAGMVMVNYGGRAREAQIRAAKGDIANLSTAVDLFALDNNDTVANRQARQARVRKQQLVAARKREATSQAARVGKQDLEHKI